MYGKGILKGLSVTWKRYWNTYIEDIAWFFRRLTGGKSRYYTPEGVARRSSKDTRGIFTIQYPEEKLPTPEEFRYVPFLVTRWMKVKKQYGARLAVFVPKFVRHNVSGSCARMTRRLASLFQCRQSSISMLTSA